MQARKIGTHVEYDSWGWLHALNVALLFQKSFQLTLDGVNEPLEAADISKGYTGMQSYTYAIYKPYISYMKAIYQLYISYI